MWGSTPLTRLLSRKVLSERRQKRTRTYIRPYRCLLSFEGVQCANEQAFPNGHANLAYEAQSRRRLIFRSHDPQRHIEATSLRKQRAHAEVDPVYAMVGQPRRPAHHHDIARIQDNGSGFT